MLSDTVSKPDPVDETPAMQLRFLDAHQIPNQLEKILENISVPFL